LGWADLGVYGQTEFETPNLDRLAGEGVRFTQAYANSAVCSATRFALMTGRYPYRLPGGLEEPLIGRRNLGLPPERATLASLLRDAGYPTGLFGKWHLGDLPDFGPLRSGYEYFFGNYGGAVDYFTYKPPGGPQAAPGLYENEEPVERSGYYTYLLTDEAEKYIAQRAGQDAPFLLSLHFTAPHWPWEGPNDEVVSRDLKDLFHYDGGSLKVYAEMVKALDESVGRVLAALDEHSLRENTIVVFTSDNGGERFSKNRPFIGQKSELLEGGLRVPTLMRWPGRLSPQVSEQVTITMDWLPTLLAAVGVSPSAEYPLDGADILPVLEGRAAEHERTLHWRYKSHHQRAVRDGRWKYLKINDHEFLFDLVEDVRERANLKQKHPDIFGRLQGQWLSWDVDMLPVTEDVVSVPLTPDVQAERYTSDRETRSKMGARPLS
jgi:arylsulfatase A-like enzyme